MNSTTSRFKALDVLRGFTIASMIIVNNPGSWAHMYYPLDHAEWNGVTPTDFIFPFFMFIMGISMAFSLRKHQSLSSSKMVLKILKRSVLLYLVGFCIVIFSRLCNKGYVNFSTVRLTGVLARLAVSYLFASLVVMFFRKSVIKYLIAFLLIAYSVLLLTCHGFDMNSQNIISIVDCKVLGSHMYAFDQDKPFNFDPEGLLSTLPSIAHVLIGYFAGLLLLKEKVSYTEKVLKLLIYGSCGVVFAFLAQYLIPLNKHVWSPTFVIATCGAGSIILALLIWLIDVKKNEGWSTPLVVIGINPLFCFILSDIYAIVFAAVKPPLLSDKGTNLSIIGVINRFMINPIFGEGKFSSLMFSFVILFLTWIVAVILYKKRIVVKL